MLVASMAESNRPTAQAPACRVKIKVSLDRYTKRFNRRTLLKHKTRDLLIIWDLPAVFARLAWHIIAL